MVTPVGVVLNFLFGYNCWDLWQFEYIILIARNTTFLLLRKIANYITHNQQQKTKYLH
jgi:hypothetical protein